MKPWLRKALKRAFPPAPKPPPPPPLPPTTESGVFFQPTPGRVDMWGRLIDPGDWQKPRGWSEPEKNLYFKFSRGRADLLTDTEIQDKYHSAYFDMSLSTEERKAARQDYIRSLVDEYGILFTEPRIFDWADYRAWCASEGSR